MHNVRTREGRAALDSDILHHLQASTQKAALGLRPRREARRQLQHDPDPPASLQGLIDANKVGSTASPCHSLLRQGEGQGEGKAK